MFFQFFFSFLVLRIFVFGFTGTYINLVHYSISFVLMVLLFSPLEFANSQLMGHFAIYLGICARLIQLGWVKLR